jgi:hypothetical protein
MRQANPPVRNGHFPIGGLTKAPKEIFDHVRRAITSEQPVRTKPLCGERFAWAERSSGCPSFEV